MSFSCWETGTVLSASLLPDRSHKVGLAGPRKVLRFKHLPAMEEETESGIWRLALHQAKPEVLSTICLTFQTLSSPP